MNDWTVALALMPTHTRWNHSGQWSHQTHCTFTTRLYLCGGGSTWLQIAQASWFASPTTAGSAAAGSNSCIVQASADVEVTSRRQVCQLQLSQAELWRSPDSSKTRVEKGGRHATLHAHHGEQVEFRVERDLSLSTIAVARSVEDAKTDTSSSWASPSSLSLHVFVTSSMLH